MEAKALAGRYVRFDVFEFEGGRTLELELGQDGTFNALHTGEQEGQNRSTEEEVGRANGRWTYQDGFVCLEKKTASGTLKTAFGRYKVVEHLSVIGLLPDEQQGDIAHAKRFNLYPFLWLLLPDPAEKWTGTAAQKAETEKRKTCWAKFAASFEEKDQATLAKCSDQLVTFDGERINSQSATELIFQVRTERGSLKCVIENILDSTRQIEFWPCGMNGGWVTGKITKWDTKTRTVYIRPISASMLWAR
jgi:uncharacterized protein YchJ